MERPLYSLRKKRHQMIKNKNFLIGLLLSPFVFLFFWFINLPKTPEVTPETTAATAKLTLLDINFIPKTPRTPVSTHPFYFVAQEGDAPLQKTIADFSGKPVILHFWATWCGPCVEEMPVFDTFAKNKKDDVYIIAITTDRTKGEAIRSFYKENNINNLNIYFDENGTVASALKASSLPTSVFINKSGEEVGRIVGAVAWNDKAGEVLLNHIAK